MAKTMLMQVAGACGTKDIPLTEQRRSFVLAMIGDCAPRDAVERMLSAQMVATHASLMAVSMKMNDAETLQQHEVYERSFNRLARTFTAQAMPK